MDNKMFPGYQSCQLVKRRKNQCFEDHLSPRLQGSDKDRDGPRDVDFSPLNELTQLLAQEYFIIQSRRES
jgi:hypothetical protein